ncbi:MAG: FAD-binding protein [Caldilineaceae bacterium]
MSHPPQPSLTPSFPRSPRRPRLSCCTREGRTVRIGHAPDGDRAGADVWLSTGALGGIHTFAPDDLYVTAGAGVTVDELQAFVSEHGMYVPLASPWPDTRRWAAYFPGAERTAAYALRRRCVTSCSAPQWPWPTAASSAPGGRWSKTWPLRPAQALRGAQDTGRAHRRDAWALTPEFHGRAGRRPCL